MRSLGNLSSEDFKQLQHAIEQQARRLHYIEVRKIASVQQKLSELDKRTPQLVWIAIVSSLAIGSLSIFNYCKWRQLDL